MMMVLHLGVRGQSEATQRNDRERIAKQGCVHGSKAMPTVEIAQNEKTKSRSLRDDKQEKQRQKQVPSAARDDNGEGDGSIEIGCRTEAFFITLDGPVAHDSSGQDDNFFWTAGDR